MTRTMIDKNTVQFQAATVRLYAGGFGSRKEQSKVILGASLAALEYALKDAKQETNPFVRKAQTIARIEAAINRKVS